jgi:hypothetical protein
MACFPTAILKLGGVPEFLHDQRSSSLNQEVMADKIAVVSAADAIAVVKETAKLPASNPATESEEQSQMTEPMQIDESNLNVRSKPRTLAIVAALYMVQFIAALDQTIIA